MAAKKIVIRTCKNPNGMSDVQLKTALEDQSYLRMDRAGVYYLGDRGGWLANWTIFTKDEHCKRGEYADEIDVKTYSRRKSEAERVARAAMLKDYVASLRVSRVIWRG
jgi:hypothetical protein